MPRFSLASAMAVLTCIVSMLASPATAGDLGPDGHLCLQETQRQERLNRLPPHLVTAISHVESGRWDDVRGEKVAWPWTVMAEGRGRFFRSKQEAVREVRDLRARGVKNIDVGCMQINLMYHGDAFPDLETALDPATNVGYAVEFLSRLYVETGSWARAATRYHSATPEYAQRYQRKVIAAWKDLNEQGTAGTGETHLANDAPAGAGSIGLIPKAGPSAAQLASIAERERQTRKAAAERERQVTSARAFANTWRAERLAEYLRTKRSRLLEADAS